MSVDVTTGMVCDEPLALLGGPEAVPNMMEHEHLFRWPIVTEEDEAAVIEVLRTGNMSGTDITEKFESEWGQYLGTKYNLGHCNGTSALLSAMYGAGVGHGDEVICPDLTFWASIMQTYLLGATPVLVDIDPQSLCIDPARIEEAITENTKAIMVVHLCGHPCDMDRIIPIARAHGVKVIEDVSHAHGARYRGEMVGTLGDVAGMSMMTGKSFAIGEGGMLSTNDREIYERAIAFQHYERAQKEVTLEYLKSNIAPLTHSRALPCGGLKGRLNQMASAMGRVQLKYYERRIVEIQRAHNRFWDLLEGVPGIRPHRVPQDEGSTMGGWCAASGHYISEELGGLPIESFIEAVNAEGGRIGAQANFPLHTHPVLNTMDAFGDGKPTRIALAHRDVRKLGLPLPVSESIRSHTFGIPRFKLDEPGLIEQYASAYRKVCLRASDLIK